jgi:hypothetical protein
MPIYNLHHFNLSLPNLCEAHEYSHVADSGVDRKGTTNTLNKSENCLIESGNIYFLESNSNISKSRTIVNWNRLPQTAVLSDSVKSFRVAIAYL